MAYASDSREARVKDIMRYIENRLRSMTPPVTEVDDSDSALEDRPRFIGSLDLVTTFDTKIRESRDAGADHIMSANDLFLKLNFIEKHIPHRLDTCTHMWVDSLLLRAMAMTPNTHRVVLTAAPTIRGSPAPASSGRTDYIQLYVPESWAETALVVPDTEDVLQVLPSPRGLFVGETKAFGDPLYRHREQAVAQMLGCAKIMNLSHIRGALTNGKTWWFILLALDPVEGNIYWVSDDFHVFRRGRGASEPSVHMVAGILAHWAAHSDEDVSDDDWFFKHTSTL